MQFTTRKKRQAPAVIIISLIDILIVLLIFMIVTPSFKNFPSVKLVLPEAKQAKQTKSTGTPIIVTITKNEPHYYLYANKRPATITELQTEFTRQAAASSNASVVMRPDKDAAFEVVLKVIEAANAAKIKNQLDIAVKRADQ